MITFRLKRLDKYPAYQDLGDLKMKISLTQKTIKKIASLSMAGLIAGVMSAKAAEVVQSDLVAPASRTATGTESAGLYSSHFTITSLARSLGSDRATTVISNDDYIARVFDYVRDNIETLPFYGVKKGAVGAYYDNAGTPFDQAMLMMKLLEERSGISANYKLGTLELTGAQFNNLYGITDAEAACQILADGGIPAEITVGSTAHTSCSTIGASDVVTSVKMDHVWVTAASVDYDPSYKTHTEEAGIDIADKMVSGASSYDQNTFWTAANVTTGTQNGMTTVTGANVTTTGGIEDKLESYATELATDIRDNQFTESLDSIVGGRYVDPADQDALTTNTTGTMTNVSTTSDFTMPDAYRTKLIVTHNAVSHTLYADQFYGLRLWMNGNDLMVGNHIEKDFGGTSTTIKLEVDHPYPADAGDYGDRDITQTTSTLGNASIMFATGRTSSQMARLMVDDSYQTAVLADDLSPVAEVMNKLAAGASWTSQYSQLLALDSSAQLGNGIYQHHDTLGLLLSYSDDDVKPIISTSISFNEKTGDSAKRLASIKSVNAMVNVIDGVILDQIGDNGEADDVRTALSMFAESLADGNKIIAFTKDDVNKIDVEASHYYQSNRDDIKTDLNDNDINTIETYLMVSSFSGLQDYDNAQPVLKYSTGNNIALTTLTGGKLVSFRNANEVEYDSALPGGNAGAVIRDNNPQLVSGEYGDSATDIVTGAGSFPMALSFTRSFQLSRLGEEGKGWRHNYDITAELTSNGLLAFSNPIAASQAIAALKVMHEVNEAVTGVDGVVGALLVANWMRQETVNNMFTVRTAGGSDFYYNLAGDTWHAMNGSFSSLTKTGSAGTTKYTVESLAGNKMIFGHVSTDHYRVDEMTWPNGLGVKFTYTGNDITVENNVGRSLDILLDANDKLESVEDNVGRIVNYNWTTAGGISYIDSTNITTVSGTAARNAFGSGITQQSKQSLTWDGTAKKWTVKKWDLADLGASNQIVTQSVNRLGQIETSETREGDISHFYASQRRGETVGATGGVSTTFTNHQGLTYRAINALGHESISEFYNGGQLYRTATPLGQGSEITYNKYGNVLESKSVPAYDHDSNPATTNVPKWNDIGQVSKVDYDNISFPHLPTKMTDAENHVTSFDYDANGFLTKTTLPSVDVYDVANASTSTPPIDNEISYTSSLTPAGYASGGGNTSNSLILPEIVTDAAGTKTHTTYNNKALATKTSGNYDDTRTKGQDGFNIESEYTYDDFGNQYNGEDHRQNQKQKIFNIRRQVVEHSDNVYSDTNTHWWPDGLGGYYTTTTTTTGTVGQVLYTFDAAGRVTEVESQTGIGTNITTQSVYDTMGRIKTTIDGADDEVNYTYDTVLSSPVTINDPDGGTNGIGVSMAEVVADVIEENGSVTETRTSRVYTDVLGRTVRTVVAPGTWDQTIEDRGYNENGQLAWVRDGNNNVTRYTYDLYGRADKTIYPDTTSTQASNYDKLGQPGTLKKRDGSTFTLSYDAHGRITSRVVKNQGGATERTYTFKFDIMGNANFSEVNVVGGNVVTNTATYDHFSRKLVERDDFGKGTDYEYNDDSGQTIITYEDGGMSSDTFKVIKSTNFRGQLLGVSYIRNGGSSTNLVSYNYDQIGRMTKYYINGGESTTYDYEADSDLDSLDIYISGTGNSVKFDYSFNLVGQVTGNKISNDDYVWNPGTTNVTNEYGINEMNQVETENSNVIEYDENGNLETKGDRTLTWSVENYLLKVENTLGDLGEYQYDAFGRRIEKIANGNDTTRYVYDGSNVIAELDGDSSNAVEYRYVYGQGVDRPIARISKDGSGIDVDNYFFDGQGTVIAMAGDSATEKYTYDPYGVPDQNSGNVYRYTGRRLDAETGYYYYRARYYDPDMGRFLSADPIGYGDGLNMYAYVANDPMNYTDPSGMDACDPGGDSPCPKWRGSAWSYAGYSFDANGNILVNQYGGATINETLGLTPSGTPFSQAGGPGYADDNNGQGPGIYRNGVPATRVGTMVVSRYMYTNEKGYATIGAKYSRIPYSGIGYATDYNPINNFSNKRVGPYTVFAGAGYSAVVAGKGEEQSTGGYITFDSGNRKVSVGAFNSRSVEAVGANISGDYFIGFYAGDFQGPTLNINLVLPNISMSIMLGIKNNNSLQFGFDMFNGDIGGSLGRGPGLPGGSVTGSNTVTNEFLEMNY